MSARGNNHKAIVNGYLEDSKEAGKRIPAWKQAELERNAMEQKIGVDVGLREPAEPHMIWKVSPDSLTEEDHKILAKRKAYQEEVEKPAREAAERAEIERLEGLVREKERIAESLESDYLRKTGVITW